MEVNGKPIDYDVDGLIPAHMRGGMQRYIEDRVPPGSFLTAVLSNDLIRAVECADFVNKTALHRYVEWLYNYAPSQCFGSPEKVRLWLEGRT